SSIRTISLSSGWDIVGAGDTDADGKADLIVRNAPSNQLGVWYMEGSLLKGSALLTNLGPSWTVEGMSDLDGDGNSDILFRNYYNGENAVWYMSGGAVSGGTLITPSVASTYWQIGNN
ncbi:MAG: VCBS repeat-containing protein, partial [Nitrospinota bacterium]|nr:VCBS repeat-containing protein [Nitrospinota bacterium]